MEKDVLLKCLHSYWSGTVQNCSSCSIPSVANKLLHRIKLFLRSSEKDFLCNKQRKFLNLCFLMRLSEEHMYIYIGRAEIF